MRAQYGRVSQGGVVDLVPCVVRIQRCVTHQSRLRSAHGRQKVNDEVSSYDLSLEIGRTYDGMMMAIPAPYWVLFRELSDQAFANVLHE